MHAIIWVLIKIENNANTILNTRCDLSFPFLIYEFDICQISRNLINFGILRKAIGRDVNIELFDVEQETMKIEGNELIIVRRRPNVLQRP